MVRMIFRHISGSRTTDIDVVPLGAHRELILGRALSAAVRFDPRGDSRVGRQHARITWDEEPPARFILADLGSRNGTFVNGRRATGILVLGLGDVVQLGQGGPAIEVCWETAHEPFATAIPPSIQDRSRHDSIERQEAP